MIFCSRFFLQRLIFASAFAEHLRGVGALLDQNLRDLQVAGIVQRLRRVHMRFLQRGLHHPDRAETFLFAGLHGG